jgi:tetratricopeptide (TPR) repeat protein
VIARSSVYRFKGTQLDLRKVGDALGVRALLNGTVTLRGDRLSVSAELLSTSDLRRIWGGKYERTLAEAAGLQDDIVESIANGLKLKLGTRSQRTADPTAYQLYLQGRHWWNKRPTQGAVPRAMEFFNQAIARDARFALPYVGLADSYNTLAAWESGLVAPNEAFPKAHAAATRALKLDPALAEAHTSLGYAELHFGWDWRRAEKEFKNALTLNPNYAHCHHWYSHYLVATGRLQESLAESIRILELDPFDLIFNVHLAWHYYMARQYAGTYDQAERTLAIEPAYHWAYFFRGLALDQLQRQAEAVDAFRRSHELSGGSTVMLSALGHAYASAGDAHSARKVLASLITTSRQRYVSSYEIALIHVALGENERAFEWFDRALEERSGWFPYLNADPRLDCLRRDPRLAALAARIGLHLTQDQGRALAGHDELR